MGGIGSGRHWGSGKDTTSDYFALDVRRLQRDGLLQPCRSYKLTWSRNGEAFAFIDVRAEWDHVRLLYRHRLVGEDWKSEDYPVTLEWTSCNYGGQRPWFRCPVVGCGRRVAVLYSGGIFACRHCHRLNYESQHEQRYQRALTRYQNIRVKLGAHAAIGPFPDKPKGMHWRTYNRLGLRLDVQSHSEQWRNSERAKRKSEALEVGAKWQSWRQAEDETTHRRD